MKKTLLLRVVLAGFLLAGLSLFADFQHLQAQTTLIGDPILGLPTGQFVDDEEAARRVDAGITFIKGQLENTQPGTQAFRNLTAKMAMYEATMNSLQEGKGVPVSIQDGVMAIATDQYGLAKQVLYGYKTELIEILRP